MKQQFGVDWYGKMRLGELVAISKTMADLGVPLGRSEMRGEANKLVHETGLMQIGSLAIRSEVKLVVWRLQ